MSYHADHPVARIAIRFLLPLLILVIATPAVLSAAATPDDLDRWSAWVVDDIEDYGCPIAHNANTRHCNLSLIHI